MKAASVVGGNAKPAKEYQVKAAFLARFLSYTTWPKGTFPDDETPIRLAVIGKDPFGKALDAAFQGRKFHKRVVRIVRHAAVPKKIDAHVVFVGGTTEAERTKLLDGVRGKPVLVVGELPGLARRGAIINFYFEKKRIRFEINTTAAAKSKLTLSSELLKLARIVTGEEER